MLLIIMLLCDNIDLSKWEIHLISVYNNIILQKEIKMEDIIKNLL
jgi:hypothetical protein